MTRIISFDNLRSFIEYNQEEFSKNHFIYYHLTDKFEKLENGALVFCDAYNIEDENGNSVICLWITGYYFIYGHQWNEAVIQQLSEKTNLWVVGNHEYFGRRDLILELFAMKKLDIQIVRDRVMHTCSLANSPIGVSDWEVVEALDDDLEELTAMMLLNYSEKNSGKMHPAPDHMKRIAEERIYESALYVLRYKERIVGMAQISNGDDEKPLIRYLYTKPAYRNQGCATMLLARLTQLLLKQNATECGIFSDAGNHAFNKAILHAGYQPAYPLLTVGVSKRETSNKPA